MPLHLQPMSLCIQKTRCQVMAAIPWCPRLVSELLCRSELYNLSHLCWHCRSLDAGQTPFYHSPMQHASQIPSAGSSHARSAKPSDVRQRESVKLIYICMH